MSKSFKIAPHQADQAMSDVVDGVSSLTGPNQSSDLFESISDLSQFRTEDLRALRHTKPAQSVLPLASAKQICSHALLFNLQAMAEFGQRQYPFACNDGAVIDPFSSRT